MAVPDDFLPEQDMHDLRGRQSVRATFRLSQKSIDAICLVAVHMGIKQKSLFDHIVAEMAAATGLTRAIPRPPPEPASRRQKTYVLSRRTVDALHEISRNCNMPRDILVEYAVQKLESVISHEKQSHILRKQLAESVFAHFQAGERIMKTCLELLGEEDPFCRHLFKTVLSSRKTAADITDFLEKSRVLEDF
jgi:hypothetical protein